MTADLGPYLCCLRTPSDIVRVSHPRWTKNSDSFQHRLQIIFFNERAFAFAVVDLNAAAVCSSFPLAGGSFRRNLVMFFFFFFSRIIVCRRHGQRSSFDDGSRFRCCIFSLAVGEMGLASPFFFFFAMKDVLFPCSCDGLYRARPGIP